MSICIVIMVYGLFCLWLGWKKFGIWFFFGSSFGCGIWLFFCCIGELGLFFLGYCFVVLLIGGGYCWVWCFGCLVCVFLCIFFLILKICFFCYFLWLVFGCFFGCGCVWVLVWLCCMCWFVVCWLGCGLLVCWCWWWWFFCLLLKCLWVN